VTRVGELERRREPRQAAADDCRSHQRPRPTIRSFVSVER
jgi:hypothetical protein